MTHNPDNCGRSDIHAANRNAAATSHAKNIGHVIVPDTGDYVVRDGVIQKVAIDIISPMVAYAYGEWTDSD